MTMSGRVTLRISLQPSKPWKSASDGSSAWSMVPIAPSATTTRLARASRRKSSQNPPSHPRYNAARAIVEESSPGTSVPSTSSGVTFLAMIFPSSTPHWSKESIPRSPLGEHRVLVQRNQSSQCTRVQNLGDQGATRAIPGITFAGTISG